VLQLVILMPLILAADVGAAAGVYGFILPWLLPVFGIVNLPFVVGAFREFQMDLQTRRNHALEHATILCLEANSRKRFSGYAEQNGFRVAGHASVKEIRTAFEHVRRAIQSGERLSYVSPRCGSNITTALGFGLGLLLFVAIWTVLFDPPLFVRASALIAVVFLFVGLRHGIGNVIQRRYCMAVDFEAVHLRNVRSVRRELFERGPVHFVETLVLPKSAAPSHKPLHPTAAEQKSS
jgi:hypothetical protein